MKSNWERDGEFIRFMYLGEYPAQGTVVSSRVKYGGKIQHTVSLANNDLELVFTYKPKGTTILVDEEEIVLSSRSCEIIEGVNYEN